MWNYQIEENILYEDKEILVCRKTAGMPVQAAKIGTMDMESALKNYLVKKTPGKIPYLGVVHRLDQPVEGILVFAKTPEAAGNLSKQMMAGGAGKYYLAVTEGKAKKLRRDSYRLSEKKWKSQTCLRLCLQIHREQKKRSFTIKF